jgi:hypothetical protein
MKEANMNPKQNHAAQSERHLNENQERIDRQKKLIHDLERDGHENALPAARELLHQLEQLQRTELQHLRLERSLSQRPS